MKRALILLIMLLNSQNFAVEDGMVEIRNLYEKAAANKAANEKLIQLLDAANENRPLLTGYKGAAIMMQANHAINPLTKLNRFNTGKKLIEKAIAAANSHMELRYVRLTIQTNLPKFLGYHDDIEKDKKLLIKGLGTVKDIDLRNRIVNYLTSKNICNADEIEEIKLWKNK